MDVTLTIKGETTDVETKVVRLVDALDKTNRSGKEMGSTFDNLGRKVRRDLTHMVAGWASVGTVIGVVHGALSNYRHEMDMLHESSDRATKTMASVIAASGDFAKSAQIRGSLLSYSLRMSGVSPTEAPSIYGAVRAALPSRSVEDVLALTTGVAHAKLAGFQGEHLTGLATTAGELAKAMPGLSPQDIVNMATYVQTQLGKHGAAIEKSGWKGFQQWQAMGLGAPEQGLGYLLASLQTEQKSAAFAELVGELAKQPETTGATFGKALTPAGRLKQDFYELSPAERLARLTADKGVRAAVFGEKAPGMEAMLGGKPAELTGAVEQARIKNYLFMAIDAAMQDPEWAKKISVFRSQAAAGQKAYQEGYGEGKEVLEYLHNTALAQGRTGIVAVSKAIEGTPMVGDFYRWAAAQDKNAIPTQGTSYLSLSSDERQKALESIEMAGEKLNRSADALNDAAANLKNSTGGLPAMNNHTEN